MKDRLNILHLEDDRRDVELVQTALKRGSLDAAFTIAQTSQEFFAAMGRQPFDVILSDNKLPGFDGTEALRAAREKQPGVPFIFVSGFASPEQARQKLKDSGAADCVSKSDLQQLASAIVKAIGGPSAKPPPDAMPPSVHSLEELVGAFQDLSLARDRERIMAVACRAARALTGAEGAAFVLREEDQCFYAEEEAVAPLWKGSRFPIGQCISGWVMLNRQPAAIENIHTDPRVPADNFRRTFVHSLILVPIRTVEPLGAIGAYWAARRQPRPEEVRLLHALADCTATAMENVQRHGQLERRTLDRTVCLRVLHQELEVFAHSMSRDGRAPLRQIDTYVERLRDDAGDTLDATSRRHLAVIAEAGRRMAALVDDFLAFSRTGHAELQQTAVDLNELVQEVLGEMGPEIRHRAISWAVGTLPTVTGDRPMLKQAWANLLSNAIKFTRHRIRAEIRVGAIERGAEAEFFVQDNGSGFDMKFADRLFGVFQRLHNTEEFEGAGVGLANVRRIVARHGGTTWAEGHVDAGATFRFTLPTKVLA